MMGHYPLFSAGDHGDSSELVTYLQPLIQKHHVHAYLCGRDHISERLQYNGTEHFVAGSGSMVDELGDQESVAYLVWVGEGYGTFVAVEATAEVY